MTGIHRRFPPGRSSCPLRGGRPGRLIYSRDDVIDGRKVDGVFHFQPEIPDHAESLRTGHLVNKVPMKS